MSQPRRKFFVQTFGCQMNEHDSERLAGLLTADGLERAAVPEEADVVVLNTCCVREKAVTRLYGRLGQLRELKRDRPDVQIAVGGCLAQQDREGVLARAAHVDVVFGTHNLGRAPALLRRAAADGPVVEIVDHGGRDLHAGQVSPSPAGGPTLASPRDGSLAPEAPGASVEDAMAPLAVRRDLPHAAWVAIQSGCNNTCSFCIVPSVRGGEVSRPFDEVLQEVEALAGRGVVEITLLGQNVNSYGRDITRRRPLFADLLRAVGAVAGIQRVRFTSPHPKDLRPETIAAMAETPAVCEHLHLPLQSGSNAVLTAMRRGYSVERYMARLASARAAIADLAVTTDLIVGFPGESDLDFDRTLEAVASAGYDSAYTFIFSPRPGTRAASMTERFVPQDVVRERFEALVRLVERSALRRNEARLHAHEEVIVEGRSKKDPSTWTGRTRQNKLVHFQADGAGAVGPGSRVTVVITSASPHHLMGRLVDVSETPRSRLRIPVRSG